MLEACALEPAVDTVGSFTWDVPDGWQQDRGAWGGLVVAAIVRAASLSDPGRSVRTVSTQIPAPVLVGRHVVEATAVKRGSALSVWSVAIRPGDGGAPVAIGTVLLGDARVPELATGEWGMATRPPAPAWQAVPVVEVGPPVGPVFAEHVEFRVIDGIPFTGGQAQALGYVRLRQAQAWDAATLLGLVDAWWPASFSRLERPHPAATISFEAHLQGDPAEVPEEPLLFSSVVQAAGQGYTTERRTLWHPDGRLLVENLQSIAIIR